MIFIILAITFLCSIDTNKLRHYQMARILTYLINYFIRNSDQYIDYNVFNEKLKEHFDDKLPQLPESPDQISIFIKIRLSLFLPIKDRSMLTTTVRTLCTYNNFDRLPDTYFHKNSKLPED